MQTTFTKLSIAVGSWVAGFAAMALSEYFIDRKAVLDMATRYCREDAQ